MVAGGSIILVDAELRNNQIMKSKSIDCASYSLLIHIMSLHAIQLHYGVVNSIIAGLLKN